MGQKWDKNIVKLGVVLTISVCVCILFADIVEEKSAIFAFLSKLGSALSPFIIGLVIAFLLNPIMVYFRRGIAYLSSKVFKKTDYDTGFRQSKIPALVLTFVFFVVLIGGFLRIVIPHIYDSLTDLVEKAPGYLKSAENWLDNFFKENSKFEKVNAQDKKNKRRFFLQTKDNRKYLFSFDTRREERREFNLALKEQVYTMNENKMFIYKSTGPKLNRVIYEINSEFQRQNIKKRDLVASSLMVQCIRGILDEYSKN